MKVKKNYVKIICLFGLTGAILLLANNKAEAFGLNYRERQAIEQLTEIASLKKGCFFPTFSSKATKAKNWQLTAKYNFLVNQLQNYLNSQETIEMDVANGIGRTENWMSSFGRAEFILWKFVDKYNDAVGRFDKKINPLKAKVIADMSDIAKNSSNMSLDDLKARLAVIEKDINELHNLTADLHEEILVNFPRNELTLDKAQHRIKYDKIDELVIRVANWKEHIVSPETQMDEQRREAVVAELRKIENLLASITSNPNRTTTERLAMAELPIFEAMAKTDRSYGFVSNNQSELTDLEKFVSCSDDKETSKTIFYLLSMITDGGTSPFQKGINEDSKIESILSGARLGFS